MKSIKSDILSVDQFLLERPDMNTFGNEGIQSTINTIAVLLDGECGGLISRVWYVTDPLSPDYRNEWEKEQIFEAFVSQTQFTLNLGNDYTQGSESFSMGGINGSFSRPKERDVIAPGVLKLLSNGRVYQLQAFIGPNEYTATVDFIDPMDQPISRSIGDKRYLQLDQPQIPVGMVPVVGTSNILEFKNPSELPNIIPNDLNNIHSVSAGDSGDGYTKMKNLAFGGPEGKYFKVEDVGTGAIRLINFSASQNNVRLGYGTSLEPMGGEIANVDYVVDEIAKIPKGKTYTGTTPIVVDNIANTIALDKTDIPSLRGNNDWGGGNTFRNTVRLWGSAFCDQVPLIAYSITNKEYVDTKITESTSDKASLSGNNEFTGINAFSGLTLCNEIPSTSNSLTNKLYVDNKDNQLQQSIDLILEEIKRQIDFRGTYSPTITYMINDAVAYSPTKAENNFYISLVNNNTSLPTDTTKWLKTSPTVEIDLSNYYNKQETNTLLNDKVSVEQWTTKYGQQDTSIAALETNKADVSALNGKANLNTENIYYAGQRYDRNGNVIVMYGDESKYIEWHDETRRYAYIGRGSSSNKNMIYIVEEGNLTLQASGELILVGSIINASQKRITNLATPIAGGDATTKDYVDGKFYKVECRWTGTALTIKSSGAQIDPRVYAFMSIVDNSLVNRWIIINQRNIYNVYKVNDDGTTIIEPLPANLWCAFIKF